MSKQTPTKIFNGKRYTFYGAEYYKKDAEGVKKYLKRKGYLVRVVRLEGHYCIYVRKE